MNSDAAAGPNSAARADGAGCPLTGAPPDGGTDRVASEEAILSRAKAILFAERGVQALGLGAAASRAAAAAGSSCTSGYCPPAETAAAGQAGSRPLGPAQGACSPPPVPAHAAHAAPHAHRPTQAQAPRPAHARRSRRRSRPSRAPCSRGQMRAQGRLASRRAPAGGAPSCCNGRSWPAERSLGGRATADGPPCTAAARTRGSLHCVRLERFRVC